MNLVFIVCKREKRGDLNEADIQWGASGNHLPAPVRGELCYQQNLHVTLARSRKAHLSIQNLFAKLVEFCCFNAFCLSPTVKIFSPLLGTREIKFVDYCPFPKSHCNRSWGFKVKNDESCKKKKEACLAFKKCSHSECQRNNRCSVLLLLHLDLERERREIWGLTLALLVPGNRAGHGQTKVGLSIRILQNSVRIHQAMSTHRTFSETVSKWNGEWEEIFSPISLITTLLLLTLLAQKQNYHT